MNKDMGDKFQVPAKQGKLCELVEHRNMGDPVKVPATLEQLIVSQQFGYLELQREPWTNESDQAEEKDVLSARWHVFARSPKNLLLAFFGNPWSKRSELSCN